MGSVLDWEGCGSGGTLRGSGSTFHPGAGRNRVPSHESGRRGVADVGWLSPPCLVGLRSA